MESTFGSVPVLYRRATVSEEDFSRYWRDIHGVFVAAFLGPSRYRMLHFDRYDQSTWNDTSVSKELAEARHLGGIAEFVFPTEADRTKWLNTVGGFADADDAVVFRRSTSYSVSQKGYKSLKEMANASDADEGSTRIFAMLKTEKPGEEFRQYIHDSLGSVFSKSENVLHAQTTVYAPYEVPTREFFGGGEVERFLRPDEQHQATIEVVFKDDEARRRFFEDEFSSHANEFSGRVYEVHAYRVKGAYMHLQDSSLTLTGWLGASRAALARRVNALNITGNLERANAMRLANAYRAGEGWKRVGS